jgi:hypothetical protein
MGIHEPADNASGPPPSLRQALKDCAAAGLSGVLEVTGEPVEACGVEPGAVDSQFALEPAAEVGWLLAEASRRMRVLASSRGLVEHDRDRMAAAPGAVQPGVLLGQGQDEILALANGRRTPCDMAFALGQGVYATTLQLARMYGAGLLVTASRRAVTTVEQTQASRPAAVPGSEPEAPSPLPRRRKGRAQHRRDSDSDAGPDLPSLLRLLRPRSGGE